MGKKQATKKHYSGNKTHELAERLYTTDDELAKAFGQNRQICRTLLFVRSYAPIDELRQIIATLDAYALILHDKDINEDGSPKASHYHLLAYRKKGHRLTLYAGLSGNTMVEVPHSKRLAYEYLLHKNHPDKYQYPEGAISAKDPSFFYDIPLSEDEAKRQSNESFLDDLANLSRRELALKYGRDYIRNYEKYERFIRQLSDDELQADINAIETLEQEELEPVAEALGYALGDEAESILNLAHAIKCVREACQHPYAFAPHRHLGRDEAVLINNLNLARGKK